LHRNYVQIASSTLSNNSNASKIIGALELRLGVHISIAGSIDLSVGRAIEKNCNTFQIFTRNPRGWAHKTLNSSQINRFKKKLARSNINPVIAHMPYLPNLASPKEDVYSNSKRVLKVELSRCKSLKIPYLVTHLGSHLGRGKAYGFNRIITAINGALKEIDSETVLLLENTAGSKNSMGTNFDDIAHILNEIKENDRVGVCFDTCHAYAAGYDLKTEGEIKRTLKMFEKIIGTERIKVIHLNDSKRGLGSKMDRHEHIGLGMIGKSGFKNILSNPLIRELPLILETPIDSRRDDLGNLNTVRKLAGFLE
jgi:deoxyribonuclease-4